MFKLIKLHFYYIYSKILIYLLLSICGILLFYFLYEANAFSDYDIRWFNQKYLQQNYDYNLLLIIRIIIPILSIYLFGNSFLYKQDGYVKIIIKNRNHRIKYFISKIIVIIYILFFLYLILFTMNNVIGNIFIPNHIISKSNTISWINIFLLSIVMGFISLSVSLWIKQSFGYIILIIIYLIVQMIIDSSNDISFVLSFVFPILDSNSEFIFGYFNFILLFLIYLFLGIVQYYLIDF